MGKGADALLHRLKEHQDIRAELPTLLATRAGDGRP
jgi:hypothetical protein